jgi:hypothetical protein
LDEKKKLAQIYQHKPTTITEIKSTSSKIIFAYMTPSIFVDETVDSLDSKLSPMFIDEFKRYF